MDLNEKIRKLEQLKYLMERRILFKNIKKN